MRSLVNKKAIVTGGDSGIGKEIVSLFEKHGASVAIFDLTHDVDITDEEAVRKAIDKMDKIDILVNCAGIFAPGTAAQTSYSTWSKILKVNLDGAFLCSKYCAQSMLKNGGGAIINVASEAGIAAIAGQVAYNVSKAAMIHLSKSMAVDYAADNIRVNCICPGRVLTPLVQNIIDSSENPEETFRELSQDRPLMRMGSPKDIAQACLCFADDSMPYATGAVVSIDGGYTAR